ncbi:hypothetical protein DAVIS_02843 [Mycobacterium marinum]|uniref:Phage tail tape measure protein domain-containing protein n=1 Tax=Mycobacterium marinum TaxID=1781 RepID=A0A3E2MVJ3_MYCMR|nr:phage tail tape measure protein [Mycobacterium marinum]RFZ40878.1 hypothetical protein DAVIS_02843 [Mycobacterium marinum]
MTDAGGIFLDIFTRLNMASVDRTLTDVKAIMREGGVKSSRAFSEGFTLDSAKAQFGELVEVSNNAYREMELGLKNLQVAEARINNLRAQNFKRSSEEMVAAQRRVDEAISASQKLVNTASARSAAVAAAPRGRSEPESRSQIIPLPRGVSRIGAGAALGALGIGAESIRVAATTGTNMQQIMSEHQERNPAYLAQQIQGIYRLSGRVPFSPQELSSVYKDIENHGYTGQAALALLQTSAQAAVATQADLKDTTDGLMTTLKDFGAQSELTSSNTATFKKGLEDLNQVAGQLIITMGQLKGVSPDELFKSLGSVEPTAMKFMTGLSGPAASAQIMTALALGAQVGIGPQQMSHNVSGIITTLGGMSPGSKLYSAAGQLGLNPENLVSTMQSKGLFAVMQQIQAAMAAHTNPATGKVDIGWRFNNAEVNDLIHQDESGLSEGAKAYVNSHSQIREGLASPFSIKKDLHKAIQSGQIDAGDAQDILTLSQWYSKVNGPNRFTKQGSPTDLTEGQLWQIMFGRGDISRTAAIMGNSAQEGQALADQLTSTGAGALKKGFSEMMKTLPEQWKQLGSSLQALAGQLGEHAIPALTHFVGDLNGAADWLGRHKTAEQALVAVLGTIAGAWGASKVINLFGDLAPAFATLKTGAINLGQLMSNRLPTQFGEDVATAGGTLKTGATTAAAEMGTAGETLETGATEAAGEIKTAGAAFRGALVGAAAAFAAGIAVPRGDNWLQQQSWYKRATGGGWLKNPLGSMANVFLGTQEYLGKTAGLYDGPVQFGSPPDSWHQPGHARGGIVGYKFGGKVADPQPLMSMPDMKRDSILGLLPDGTPVGLRGGEGILTPEAVAKIGGKDGVDALNNPWADPWNVATTFYGSFAKGVAKYSPWGKYLEASSQTLDALQQEFDQSTEMHTTGGKKGKLYDRIIASLAKNGGAWPVTDSGNPRAKSGIVNAVKQAYLEAGFPPDQWHSLEHIISHESSWNPSARNPKSGAYGLGQFLGHEKDKYGAMGAYSGNPYYEARAMMQYIKDRYGNPANAWSFWRGHNWYSKGGVVGFDKGGVVDPAFWSPDDPKGRTHRMRHQHGTGATTWIIPQIPNDPGSMVHFPGNDSIGARAPIPHMPPFGPFADIQDRQNAAHGGIIGFNVGGLVPQPPNITDLARTHGIAPMDHIAKAPKIADKQAKPPKQQPARETAVVAPPSHIPTTGGDRGIQTNPSRQGGMDNTSKGFGLQGGLIGSAEGAVQQGIMLAGMGADAMGGGGGGDAAAMAANQAMQIGFQLANRAIGYGGQFLGILGSGLIETFLPNDSPLADPTNNLFGKVALGIAGAHPSPKNLAGQSAMQLKPKQDLDMGASAAKQVLPAVHIDQVHNHSRDANWDSMRRAIDKATFGGLGVGGQF